MKELFTFSILLLAFQCTLFGQVAFQTFKDTRVINAHSIEVLKAGKMDIRIGHRFGDLAGDAGGWKTFYGLESASDVLTGIEYGVNEKLMVGISRTKGAGSLRQNVNGLVKMKLLSQSESMPLSLTGLTMASISTMSKSTETGQINSFSKFAHRMVYHTEVIGGRKFSDRFALQASFGYTHLNIVDGEGVNGFLSVGLASRVQLNKSTGFIFDLKKPISEGRNGFNQMPLGVGLEWETGGGHVFQLNVTNSKGLTETDFLPYTDQSWADGQFRLGFTISRLFKL